MFKFAFLLSAFSLTAVSMSSGIAVAGEPREEFLGQVRLHQFGQSEPVEFTGACPSEQNRPVEAVQFHVYRRNVEVDRLEVDFNDGRHETFHIHERFPRDSVSRWFHLGGIRCVRAFRVVGEAQGWGEGHAEVQVWGLRHHHW